MVCPSPGLQLMTHPPFPDVVNVDDVFPTFHLCICNVFLQGTGRGVSIPHQERNILSIPSILQYFPSMHL